MPDYEEVNVKGVEMLAGFVAQKFPNGVKGIQ